MHRELYFKIEKLDQSDNVIEVKTPTLLKGEVSVTGSETYRRKCKFDLAEPLPDDWQTYRWRLYYGQKKGGEVVYDSVGVFLPINPSEKQTSTGLVTSYQGVDKMQLLVDSYEDAPTSFSENDTLKEVAAGHLNALGITNQNLADVPYALNTNYTFGEWQSAEHTLMAIMDAFPVDFYFDANGAGTLVELSPSSKRAVAHALTGDSIVVESTRDIKSEDYFNNVIVIGGTADTEIYRKELTDSAEVSRVNRTISRLYREDAAASQQQVDDLAAQYLAKAISIPATIKISNLPIVNLEANQVVTYNGVRYEVESFNIPLDLGLQNITARRIS